MEKYVKCIKKLIEDKLEKGYKKFILYPYGYVGGIAKHILNESYGIEESYIVDTKLSTINKKIVDKTIFDTINCEEYALILTTTNVGLLNILKESVKIYFCSEQIGIVNNYLKDLYRNKNVGKYSYGSLCYDAYVESIGAFCSFANGVCALPNHPLDYISTHPFMYYDHDVNPFISYHYDYYEEEDWWFPGIKPKGIVAKQPLSIIGNDVWLGENVLITNGANIGNGVIAGAGTVITRDIPDYAIVVGSPARIVRFRYNREEINQLNKIKWWDWEDELIRERYNDFFLPINEFIQKYS